MLAMKSHGSSIGLEGKVQICANLIHATGGSNKQLLKAQKITTADDAMRSCIAMMPQPCLIIWDDAGTMQCSGWYPSA